MRRTFFSIIAFVLTIAAEAQTLNVKVGSVFYQFPAEQTGEMYYADGKTLTIMGKEFTLADIDVITVDSSEVTNNLVSVEYGSSSASVYVAGNVAQYVEATVSEAHVIITQTNTDDIIGNEITYVLSGSTTDGSFALGGSYKCTVSLAGLTMTNPSGAAINITNGKRIQISAKDGTENTLIDGANGEQKACIYSKGQIQLQGKGTLNVAGNTKHAIKSGDYITVKNLMLNITKAVGDGISCNEYFLMKSGTINISGTQDDGIQCDLDGDTSTGETADHDDEDSGNIYLEGGTLSVNVTAAASKGIKAAGDIHINDGEITIKTTGNGTYDSEERDAKGCAGLKSDGNMTIGSGTITLNSTGTGGKCIKADGTLTVTGGTIEATTTGNTYSYSSSKAQPKAIKADGNMYISGGMVIACGAGGAECGIDAAERDNLYITGGTVLGIGAGNNTVTATTGSQCVLSTTNSTYSAGTSVAVKNGTTILASFTIPNGYSPSSGGGGRPGGGGGWGPGGGGQGGSGFSYLLSCPGLSSGTSYTVTIGSSSTSCKASTSYSGR